MMKTMFGRFTPISAPPERGPNSAECDLLSMKTAKSVVRTKTKSCTQLVWCQHDDRLIIGTLGENLNLSQCNEIYLLIGLVATFSSSQRPT